MEVIVGGDHVAGRHRVVLAVRQPRDIAAGLADQQDTRRHVPGLEPEFPEAVHPARRHIGEVERGGAEAAHADRGAHDGAEGAHIELAVNLAANGRDARGDHGLRELPPRRDPKASVVDVGALALLPPEHLVADRLVDHARDDLAVSLEPDRDAELRYAVQEVRGAALLHQKPVAGACPRELGAQHLLGLQIGLRHEVAGSLHRDLQLLDLAEVADHAARCLEGGGGHHVDQGGADGHGGAGVRGSILGALDVGSVAGVDDDARAGLDVRRDHDAPAVVELPGLVGGRRGLAAHHRIGLNHGHHDGLRQGHRHGRALVELDGHHHVFLEEVRGLADQRAVDHDLLVGLGVHEGHVVALDEQELHLLLVELHALHGLLGAVALVGLRPGLEVAHLDLREGAALARLDQLALQHDPELARVLEDVAGLDVDGVDLHGLALEIRKSRRATESFTSGRRRGRSFLPAWLRGGKRGLANPGLSAECDRGGLGSRPPPPGGPLMICFRPALAASALAVMAAAAAGAGAQSLPKTPIRHLIVVIGENMSFDNLFGTYEPPAGQSVANLLSKGIVTAEGSPGPHFDLAAQSTAAVRERYLVTPPRTGAYETLPQPGTTYALGQPQFAADPRFPASLPNGPFPITRYADWSAAVGDPVHRFFQMWQQFDGGRNDLFVWVAETSGEGSKKRDDPASGTNQGGVAMGFYNMAKGDAAYFRELARSYALADNYHQPVMGGTGANYFMLATGDAATYLIDGKLAVPPANQIENPDPRPGTNNW